MTCEAAYAQLKARFEGVFYQEYLEANAVRFGLQEGASSAEIQNKIEGAIDNLRGWSFGGANNAKNLILNTVLYDMIYKSYREESVAALNDPWTTMMEDARRQRAAQWSGEAQLWTSVMPAAASFFIGMVYALTPLVAILIIMGDFGIKLVTKYIAVLLWVMMWPIVMSIVNLYGQVSTTTEFQALIAEAGSLTSLNALDQIDTMLIDKMALLDKLVAAAATIALFLATGSMYAMTQLTGAFSSSDHVDEKKVAPDTYSSSPTLQTAPMLNADSTNGMREYGFDNVVGTLNFGSALSNTAGNAASTAKQAQEQFGTQFSKAFTSAMQGSDQSSITDNIRESWQTSSSELETLSMNAARAITKGMDVTETQLSQAAAQIALGASGSAGFKGLGNGLTIEGSGNLTRGAQDGASLQQQMQANFRKEFGDGKQLSTQLQNAVSADLAHGKADTMTSVLGQTETENLSQSASYAESMSVQAQEARTLANTFGASQSVSPLAISQNLVTSHRAEYDQLKEMARQEGVYGDAEQRATQYTDQYGGEDKALAGSIVQGLFEKFRDTDDLDGMGQLLRAISPVVGRTAHSTEGPDMSVNSDTREAVLAENLHAVQGDVVADHAGRNAMHSAVREETGSGRDYVNERDAGNQETHGVRRYNQSIDEKAEVTAHERAIEKRYEVKQNPALQMAANVAGADIENIKNAATSVGDMAMDIFDDERDDSERKSVDRKSARHGIESPN
ncbi:MAG: conjugal transfer protein TraG N-terminal domain-containing protein [Porticoccaceae bacterium]